MNKQNITITRLAYMLFILATFKIYAQTKLESDFKNPPAAFKPQTWMHVLDGNMSKPGLTKDFEALSQAGVGGVLLFNISYRIPDGKITYNSVEHRALLKHAAKECERLDLTFGIHNCDGWTSSGGPWVKPDQSMKMIVHSDTIVKGGFIKLKLPVPTIRSNYYKDVAVLAYPALKTELEDHNNTFSVTCSDTNTNISILSDKKIEAVTQIKGTKEKPQYITYAYAKPMALRSLLIYTATRKPDIVISVSDDGAHFKDISSAKHKRTGKREFNLEGHYSGISAKYIRFKVLKKTDIKEIEIQSTQTITDRLARKSMTRVIASRLKSLGNPPKTMVIDKQKIINLSKRIDQSGVLKAKLPKGNWTIMRFGMTSTGATNTPASDSGRGLEVDKFSKKALKVHYDAFVSKVVKASKPVAPNAMKYVEIDSYEMGGQNWTDQYDKMFKKRFGYDLIKFLPLYAGRFVESPKSIDAVSYDIRKLNSHLMVENYYGYFTDLCHKDGIKTYIEPYGFGPMDDLATGGKADIPMGEFWTGRPKIMVSSAVQSARAYGKNIISAEAFTSGPKVNWKGHPATFKSSGDYIWTQGVNEFMFHRYAHQANTHVAPGMTMGPWGSHFDRTNTWWHNAGKAWFKYLSRGQYLLRQGIPVSDFLIFPGDASPSPYFNAKLPNYIKSDVTNTDVLINRIKVKNKTLVTPEGITYQALIVGNIDRIELETLKRLEYISSQGVAIIGKKPSQLAQYYTTKNQQKEFNSLVKSIWGRARTYSKLKWKEILPELGVVADLLIDGEDTANYIHRKTTNADIYFIHNPSDSLKTFNCSFNITGKIPELWNPMTAQIIKLAHYNEDSGRTNVSIPLENLASTFVVFKDDNKNVSRIKQTTASLNNVKFSLNSNLKAQAEVNKNGVYKTQFYNGTNWDFIVNNIPDSINIKGSWLVQFRKQDGYDASVVFPTLSDWKDHSIDNIKHYSGTATYTKEIELQSQQLPEGHKFYLDLGQVSIAANVSINNKALGVSWIYPYKLDVTDALKVGVNTLKIEVTNLWTNRLIGDEAFPDTSGYNKKDKNMPDWYVNNQPQPKSKRSTFTVFNFYKNKASRTLISSGLIGPVTIKASKILNR